MPRPTAMHSQAMMPSIRLLLRSVTISTCDPRIGGAERSMEFSSSLEDTREELGREEGLLETSLPTSELSETSPLETLATGGT